MIVSETLQAVQTACPGCQGEIHQSFYYVQGIPVHSCELINTREEAINYPAGDLKLGNCPNCGFITNISYNPDYRSYDCQYEETQAFSEQFNTFLVALVKKLIDRYGIRDKTVLEIGCGKGEFLYLMCKIGRNHGIGIDPSCESRRLTDDIHGKIKFINDYYGENYLDIKADMICCRHTLEHIPDTMRFLKLIRKSVGRRKNVLLFFEVPDTVRVLRERAFWDIYYEHCSYFTPGSLGRILRICGFDIEELYLDYGGQYIMLVAKPTGKQAGTSSPPDTIEDSVDEAESMVRDFADHIEDNIRLWWNLIESHHQRGEKGVIWGSGSKAVSFLTTLGITEQIHSIVDINPYRQGMFMPSTGHKIISPQQLKQLKPDYVIIVNPIYTNEIKQNLNELEITPKVFNL